MLTFFFPILILLFSFASLFLVGNLILRYIYYDKNNYYYVISPLIGLTFFSIIITFLYNFLDQEINTIRYFILICIVLTVILSLKDIKKILSNFNKILILVSPILIIFIFTLFFFNENFYAFRGNYWDNFTMLSMSLIFESFKESTLTGLLLNENFQLENFKGFYDNLKESNFSKTHYNFSFQNIFTRQMNPLYLAVFYAFRPIDLFLLNYILKFLFIINTHLAFSFLLKKIINEISKKYLFFITLVFSLSFWNLYIFEIDALGQLASFSFFILILALTKDFYDKENFEDKKLFFLLTLSHVTLFLIYPTLSFIAFAFTAFIFIAKLKIVFKYYKILLFYLLIFFILVSPKLLENLSLALLNTGAGGLDYWTYFGAFFLGRENIVLNYEVVNDLKDFLLNTNSFTEIFSQILKVNTDNRYYFALFNIPVSFFGFYFVTPGQINNLISLLPLILSLFIIFFIYKNLKSNLCNIFFNNKKKYSFFKYIIFFNLLIASYLLFQKNYYGFIKLYFFFSPFLACLVLFNFEKLKKNIFNLNNVLLFVMLLFPLYKYGIYNNGIGRIDSFPSILDKNQKLEINWSLKLNQLYSCNEIYIDSDDIIKKGYLSLKLDYYDFNENNDLLNSDCAVFKNKNKFTIRKIK